jgi:hypothetical protein
MTKISKEALNLFVDQKQLEARIDEVDALRPYLTSKVYKERKTKLENSLKSLTKKENKQIINIIVLSE